MSGRQSANLIRCLLTCVKEALESTEVWIPTLRVGSIPVFLASVRHWDGGIPDVNEVAHDEVRKLVDSYRYAGMDTRLKMQPGLEYTCRRDTGDEGCFVARDIVRRFFTKRVSASLLPCPSVLLPMRYWLTWLCRKMLLCWMPDPLEPALSSTGGSVGQKQTESSQRSRWWANI